MSKGKWMPPGYKVRYIPFYLLLVARRCSCSLSSCRSASAICPPFKRWDHSPPIPLVIPRVITPQDVFFQCQAYGAFARVRLETSHRWCGGADGMCIETNSNPDGFCVSFVDRSISCAPVILFLCTPSSDLTALFSVDLLDFTY